MNQLEFNRRLRNCHIDEQTRWLISYLYESHNTLSQNMLDAAKAIAALTSVVEKYTVVNKGLLEDVERLQRHGRPDGVEVYSTRNEPDG